PLAYFMGRSGFSWWEVDTFLRPEKLGDRAGLYALGPYQPGKVPLVLIHGMLSSPMSWAPLLNALQADPWASQHYQIWLYYYPTPNHFLITAAHLREELARLRAELGRGKPDPALDEMVLIGHSQGGIIARLLTVDGGDDFLHLACCPSCDEPQELRKSS